MTQSGPSPGSTSARGGAAPAARPRSWASRQSKCVDLLSANIAPAGPPANRPPHKEVFSVTVAQSAGFGTGDVITIEIAHQGLTRELLSEREEE